MADVKAAIEAVLREEDGTLSGKIVNVAGDTGGTTRFGLAAKWHPELRVTAYYTTMPTAEALQVAVNTLTTHYAVPLGIAQIVDQALANKLLSFGVNAGVRVATATMQKAAFDGKPFLVDGSMGPKTLAVVNSRDPASLLNIFRLQMIALYADLCNKRQADRNELLGWVNRALA